MRKRSSVFIAKNRLKTLVLSDRVHCIPSAYDKIPVSYTHLDAIGLNLDVEHTNGLVIANFGGETTELSILAGGGMVMNRLLKVGGMAFDEGLVNLIRHRHDFLIGRRTAEYLRKNFGVFTSDAESMLPVAGRDLITGVPMQKTISITQMCIRDRLNTLVHDKFGRHTRVLELFVKYGAPKEILYQNKPHIGTDILIEVVRGIRNAILEMGGEIRFSSQMTDLIIQSEKMCIRDRSQ